jgi:leader peptidase (prepilin peptidase)/N-methyltransferase
MAAAILDAALLALLATVTVTDLRSRLVPDRALLAATLVAIPLAASADPTGLPERLAAALGAGGFLLLAALIRPGGMGLGDVKLGAVLGLYLGVEVAPAMLVAFVTGALVGVALIVRQGPSARKQTIPFAPCMALGALCAVSGSDWYLAIG